MGLRTLDAHFHKVVISEPPVSLAAPLSLLPEQSREEAIAALKKRTGYVDKFHKCLAWVYMIHTTQAANVKSESLTCQTVHQFFSAAGGLAESCPDVPEMYTNIELGKCRFRGSLKFHLLEANSTCIVFWNAFLQSC